MEKSSSLNPKVVSMRLYFDNTAWLSLIRQISALQTLRAAQETGAIEVAMGVENLRELVIKESVGEARRAKNLLYVAPFLQNIQSDSLFIVGHSRLDFASLSTDEISKVFESHLEGKSKPEKATADGVHISNAVAFGADLVSCDHQVRMTAVGKVRNLLCLRQLIDELGDSVIGLDDCNCSLIQQ